MRAALSAPLVMRSGRFWLGLAVSVAFLYLALRQADWMITAAALEAANWGLVLVGALALPVTFLVFAFRWRVLLGRAAPLPVPDLFSYLMISYLANTMLPLRLGDVARAVLVGRHHHISASLLFGTVLLERLLDVLAVLAIAAGLSVAVAMPPLIRAGLLTFAAAGIAALVGLVTLALAGPRLHHYVGRVPLPNTGTGQLFALMERFTAGLGMLRDGRQFGVAAMLSLLAWLIAGAGTITYVTAFHLPTPWYAGLLVLAVVNLGAAIPSSPGAIGVYHYLSTSP